MIKLNNAKTIKEIEDLRDKGLYNAPFNMQENTETKENSPELLEKINELEKAIKNLDEDLDVLVGGSDE